MELKADGELCHFAQDRRGRAGSLGPQSVGGDRELSAAAANGLLMTEPRGVPA